MQNVIYLKKTSQLRTHTAIYSVFRAEKEPEINRPQCVWLLWTCWVGLNGRWSRGPRVLEVFITKYTVWLLTSAHIKIIIILHFIMIGEGGGG